MNLFEQAISKGDLLKFALGKDEYFVADRDYGEHSVINSWINYILPLVEEKGNDFVSIYIEKMLKEVLDSREFDDKTKNEALLYHLHVYYYLDSEKRLQAKKVLSINPQIQFSFENYLALMKQKSDPKEPVFLNAMNLIKSRGGLG